MGRRRETEINGPLCIHQPPGEHTGLAEHGKAGQPSLGAARKMALLMDETNTHWPAIRQWEPWLNLVQTHAFAEGRVHKPPANQTHLREREDLRMPGTPSAPSQRSPPLWDLCMGSLESSRHTAKFEMQ